MVHRLRHAQWVIFEDSAHMAFIDETDQCLQVVEDILTRIDMPNASGPSS